MADAADVANESDLYEADEHAWIERQIATLRNGELHRLDRAHLIEYLTDMAGRDRRELASRLTVLVQHILKVVVQPERVSRSWRLTILEQQREVRRILKQIPSLARHADVALREIDPDAVKAAAADTGLEAKAFMGLACPSIEWVLTFDESKIALGPQAWNQDGRA